MSNKCVVCVSGGECVMILIALGERSISIIISVRAKGAGGGIPLLKSPPKLGRLGGQSPPKNQIPLYFWRQRGPGLGKFSICTPRPSPRREKILPKVFELSVPPPLRKKISAITVYYV